jgi:hypothetical protein
MFIYRDLELLAADMRCVAVAYNATENKKYFFNEMIKVNNILNNPKLFFNP